MKKTALAVIALALLSACHGRPCPRWAAEQKVPELFNKPYVKDAGGRKYVVYESNTTGPAVIILHEAPGLLYEDFRVGEIIAKAGYKVYMPLMFGKPGERSNMNLLRACVFGGFHCFRSHPPAILAWLRPFVCEVSHGKPVGVIGMCLTGAVPFAMLDMNVVRVAVMSQPAMPMTNHSGLAVTDAQVNAGRKAARERAAVLYFRFWGDGISPPERLDAFKTRVPEIEEHQLPPPRPGAHSVLALEYVSDPNDPTNQAMQRILVVLKERLGS